MTNFNNLERDIRNENLISLKQVAQILGLKYHTARNILYNEHSIGYVEFTPRKRMWVLADILDFKQKRYVQPQIA